MKSNSDNARSSATYDILNALIENHIKVIVYEPHIKLEQVSFELVNDIEEFKKRSNLIVANRITKDIFHDVSEKLYTRDIFHDG